MYGKMIYPVKLNSVWRAGPHTFICGDVLKLWQAGVLAKLVPLVDAVYTDPPWNHTQRILFHRYAGTEAPGESYNSFLIDTVKLLAQVCPKGRIAIEMSREHFDTLKLLVREATQLGEGLGRFDGRLYGVWFGSFNQWDDQRFDVPTLMGRAMLAYGLDKLGGQTFFDPFAGALVFAREAMRKGYTVYGCELIPAKLSRGLANLKMPVECICEDLFEGQRLGRGDQAIAVAV